MDTTRVDRWLWSVRLAKTRAEAATACRGGHVRINDRPAKPAAPVRVGDKVRARVHERNRIVEVSRIIEKRVGAPVAQECYIDHTPPEPSRTDVPVFARRERGAGRPTKRDRRMLDQLGLSRRNL
jgi:ribosome-associated heat shock protein Hsp15